MTTAAAAAAATKVMSKCEMDLCARVCVCVCA